MYVFHAREHSSFTLVKSVIVVEELLYEHTTHNGTKKTHKT